MLAQRAIHEEPIPGYRLLGPLGRGGFGEVWKCEAPGGLFKAIKFVRGSDGLGKGCAAEQELRSLAHIKSIRHPFLLSIERVEVIDGDLAVVMELADRSLHDLLESHRGDGRAGVPREELIGYLREAAEVLDLMNQEHGLQHLDIKPHNLFLVGKHIKVADFGLVNSLAEMYGERAADLLGAISPLYAAPETFENRATLFTDQYSLAVSYMQLLTGELPFKGKNLRQLLMQVTTTAPDLAALPETDRDIVRRAMSKEPRERFASCLQFVQALECAGAEAAACEQTPHDIGNTALLPPDGSGLFRRRSRVMQAVRPAAAPSPEQELLAYSLQECLNRGSAGELWRAVGPRDEPCLLRFVALPEHMADAVGRLASLKHPLLPALRLIEAGPGRVALISAAGDSSLAGRFKECQAAGLPGIPREELLPLLAHFAHGLDELYHHHQTQHLALSPRHLAMSRGEPLLLEFGLAEMLLLPLGQQPATLNPRYAAVELFDGLISDACDQYSLALIYQELLVGLHPYRNLNARQLASAKLRGQPELSLLPAPDRKVIARALSAEPEKRFRSCRELILALEEVSGYLPAVTPSARAGSRPVPALSQPGNDWAAAVDELVAGASRGHIIQSTGSLHYRLAPGLEVEQHLWARLPAGMARLKLNGFCEQHKGDALERTEQRWLIEVPAKVSLLQRCLGKTPALLVEVTFGRPRESVGDLTPVRVRLEPRDCGRAKAEDLLGDLGPQLLASLHSYFSGQCTAKGQERYPLFVSAHVSAMGGVSVTARTRDVGREAVTLLAPCVLPPGPVKLTLNRWGSALTVQIPARVRDCVPAGEGQFEVELGLG